MLSWSSTRTGGEADLAAVAAGDGRPGPDHGDALLRFASACGRTDDVELADARRSLVDETDEAFMVDAAAVAANFEMMTRLADGTGARMRADEIEAQASVVGAMGVADVDSRR